MTDLARYARQVILPEVGVNGQRLLRDSSALVVGVGGLGSVAAAYLAGAGLGRLVVADRDRVEASNLQRQILYRSADIGAEKAEAAANHLRALNPEVDVQRATAQGWRDQVQGVDVVLDCTDNFPARYAVNAACVAARTPLVSGAAIRLEGQLAVFDLARGGPCYACLYPDRGAPQETCEEAGILGPVTGVVGSLQALVALKLLLGIGGDAGWLAVWNARDGAWRRLRMSPDPRCPVCGVRTP